jgi:hypothetical protein
MTEEQYFDRLLLVSTKSLKLLPIRLQMDFVGFILFNQHQKQKHLVIAIGLTFA